MSSARTQPARGMRDFLPADVRKREYVIGVIKEVYERYGFEPLETPAVENIETLMGKYGEEGNQLIFKILKRGEHEKTGEADLALRYDLTVPLARVVAQYQNELPKFFKRYQIQPVWRADRPARGRFREFYQCDVDVLGSKSMVVEAELIAAASEVLTKLGFVDFTIRLNHRGVLNGILQVFNIPSELRDKTLITLDKLEKIGSEKAIQELSGGGVNKEDASNLIGFFGGLEHSFSESKSDLDWNHRTIIALASTAAHLPIQDVLRSGEKFDDPKIYRRALSDLLAKAENESLSEGIWQLVSILELVERTQTGVKIDFSLARGLSYYTGAIVEISVDDLAGSLGGGGRYDHLVGMFRGSDVPACGFSLGLERIIVVMTDRGLFPPDLLTSPADIMVTIWNEDSIGDSIALAHQLRAAGLRVDLYPEVDKLAKQFKYAAARGVPVVAVIGDDEITRGEVAIKDLRSGEQRSVKRDEIVNALSPPSGRGIKGEGLAL